MDKTKNYIDPLTDLKYQNYVPKIIYDKNINVNKEYYRIFIQNK